MFFILKITIISLLVAALADNPKVYEETNLYSDQEIILDHQPIKDNHVLYGVCNITANRQIMSCSIILKTLIPGFGFESKICRMNYQTIQEIGKGQFQLKLLYKYEVLFMWTVLNSTEEHLIFRTFSMVDCRHSEHQITHEPERAYSGTDAFHVVSYEDTFDLFYRNTSLCNSRMCGQTHGHDGKVINGPVPSYLPVEYFQESTFICPAMPGTSAKGHYVFSPQLRLVSSNAGLVKQLINPEGFDAVAVSSDAGLLGKRFFSPILSA